MKNVTEDDKQLVMSTLIFYRLRVRMYWVNWYLHSFFLKDFFVPYMEVLLTQFTASETNVVLDLIFYRCGSCHLPFRSDFPIWSPFSSFHSSPNTSSNLNLNPIRKALFPSIRSKFSDLQNQPKLDSLMHYLTILNWYWSCHTLFEGVPFSI